MKRHLLMIPVVSTLVCAAVPCAADALYVAGGGGSVSGLSAPGSIYSDSYYSPQNIATSGAIAYTDTGNFSQTVAVYSDAGPGYLGASASVLLQRTPLLPYATNDSALAHPYASMTLDDVTVSGNPGPVLTSLNFRLAGSVTANVAGGAGTSLPIGSGDVYVVVYVNGEALQAGEVHIDASLNAASTYSATGLFAGYNNLGPQLFTTIPFTVDANVPFSVKFTIDASALAQDYADTASLVAGNADFAHTLSFDTAGNALNLPDGYTANSLEGNIAGNQFTLIMAPEPATALLLLLPLIIPLAARRKRLPHLATATE